LNFIVESRATAQAVSHQPLAAETWLTSWIRSCGICSGQSGTGTDFSLCALVFPFRYLSLLLHCHPFDVSSWQHH